MIIPRAQLQFIFILALLVNSILSGCNRQEAIQVVANKLISSSPTQKLIISDEAKVEAIAVRAVFQDSIPVPGVSVSFSISTGKGSLSTTDATTDANGIAITHLTIGDSSNTVRVMASSEGLDDVIFNFSVTSSRASRIYLVSGNDQEALAGTSLPDELVVRITDDFENVAVQYPVVFTKMNGNATLSEEIVLTNTEGIASVSMIVGNDVLENIVVAKIGDEVGVEFKINSLYPVKTFPLTKSPLKLTINWERNINNGFKQYIIYGTYDLNTGENFRVVDSVDNIETTKYLIPTPVPGLVYHYRIDIETLKGTIITGNWEEIEYGDFIEFDTQIGDIAVDTLRNLLYITAINKNEVMVLSLTSKTVVNRISLWSKPQKMDISKDNSKLYVTLSGSGEVAIVDLETLAFEKINITEELGAYNAYDVKEGKDNRIYVSGHTLYGSQTFITTIMLDDNNTPMRYFDTSTRTYPNMVVDRDNYLFVNNDDNKLYKLDLTTDSAVVVLEKNLNAKNKILSPDGTRLYLTDGNVISTTSFDVLSFLERGIPILSEDGSTCYILTYFGIKVYDTNSFTKSGLIDTRIKDAVNVHSYLSKSMLIIHTYTDGYINNPQRIYFVKSD